MNDPFQYTSGPKDARVLLVGEAWGESEERAQAPFVGMSGRELDRILFEAGLPRNRILCTNVVDARPPKNEFEAFLVPGRDKITLLRGVRAGERLRQGYEKLLSLIDTVQPDLIIGAGNVPLWALTSHGSPKFSGIMNWRGSQTYTEEINGKRYRYLPVVHPAAVLRSWDLRAVLVHDLKARAARYLAGSLAWEPPHAISTYDGSFGWARSKLQAWIRRAENSELVLACDLETWRRKFVACIGFADAEEELCIPFFYFVDGEMKHVYTFEQELVLCELIRELLLHKNVKIIGQNWAYDYQFITRWLGIKVKPYFDTMIGQHLCWPGTPKGLDYIASLYCNHYCFWKNESQDWDTNNLGHLDLWKYNCKDVRYTYEAAQQLNALIAHEGLQEQMAFQMEQWELAAAMMDTGVCIDLDRRRAIKGDLAAAARELQQYLLDIMPENTRYADSGVPWYRSAALTKHIFYTQLGFPPVLQKKTKKLTTGIEAIDALRKKVTWFAPVLDALEQLRSIEVFRSHFIEAGLSVDWRLRCTFYVGGTETFRWSSGSNSFGEGTNLQNIPKGEEE